MAAPQSEVAARKPKNQQSWNDPPDLRSDLHVPQGIDSVDAKTVRDAIDIVCSENERMKYLMTSQLRDCLSGLDDETIDARHRAHLTLIFGHLRTNPHRAANAFATLNEECDDVS